MLDDRRPIILEMQTHKTRVGPSRSRVKLRIMNPPATPHKRSPLSNRIAPKISRSPSAANFPYDALIFGHSKSFRSRFDSRCSPGLISTTSIEAPRLYATNASVRDTINKFERIVIRPALLRRELGGLRAQSAAAAHRGTAAARSRIRIAAILSPSIQQPRNNPILTNSQPGPSGFKILPANNMRILQQVTGSTAGRSRNSSRLAANHNWTIASNPKINRQRTHQYKNWLPIGIRTSPIVHCDCSPSLEGRVRG